MKIFFNICKRCNIKTTKDNDIFFNTYIAKTTTTTSNYNKTNLNQTGYINFNTNNNNYEMYELVADFILISLITSLVITTVITSIKFSKTIKEFFKRIFYSYTTIENIIEEKELKIKNKKDKKIKNKQAKELKKINKSKEKYLIKV